ncbi:unnamed protein product, partial [Amoebophrya sp. A120]
RSRESQGLRPLILLVLFESCCWRFELFFVKTVCPTSRRRKPHLHQTRQPRGAARETHRPQHQKPRDPGRQTRSADAREEVCAARATWKHGGDDVDGSGRRSCSGE